MSDVPIYFLSRHVNPEKWRNALSCDGAFSVSALTPAEMRANHAIKGQRCIIALDYVVLDEEALAEILRFKTDFPMAEIVAMAETAPLQIYRKFARLEGVTPLHRNCPKDRLSFTMHCLTEAPRPQRPPSARFETDQAVRLLVMRTGLLVPTRMLNYSATGAFLQYRGIALRVGDFVHMNVAGSQTNLRNREAMEFTGKVVWIKDGSGDPRSPERGIGVQFTA